jgi:hypothetical protein
MAADLEAPTEDVPAYVAPPTAGDESALATTPSATLAEAATPLWGTGGGKGQPTMQSSGYGYGFYYPPEIVNFNGSFNYGGWTFEGEVQDDKPVNGLVVRFGGLLEGVNVLVQANGRFEYTHVFPPGTSGVVTVYVTDGDGLVSETEEFVIW